MFPQLPIGEDHRVLDGPGMEIWRLDAATRVEAALKAADGAPATNDAGDSTTTEGAAVWYARGDPGRALASFEPLIAAVGGEAAAAAERDERWIDIMVGLVVLARAVGDHDRVARVLHRLDRAIGAHDDPLRAVWWQCRAMAALATGSLGLAAQAAVEASTRADSGSLTGAACRRAVALVALAAGDTASAVDALADAARQFDALGLTLAAAGCKQRRAAAEALAGDHGRAWASALDALARFDAARYRVITPYGREAWLAEYAETMAIALEMAERLTLADAQVELVERARTQVALRTDRGETPSWSSALALQGARAIHVGAAEPVLTNGAADASATAIDLDLIRRRVGGADSWWWGTWRWRDTIHWSLIDPHGTTSAGSIALHGRLAFEIADLDGPPGRERALARVLGDAVLPPPLRAALDDAARRDIRLRVVVAPSAAIGGLPLASMAIGDDDSSEPRRVIDAADLVVAPSAGFIDGLVARSTMSSAARLGVVVADPHSDLAIARQVGIAIANARGGRALIGADATPAALLEALDHGRDAPAHDVTMVVIAHAVKTSIDDAVIELAGDGAAGRLGALELLHSEAWHLGDRFPARVLLATCTSAGTTSIGASGEWLGVAPALLRCGAELVLATSWPQPEHPATAAIDRAAADLLCDAIDPIGALGDLQRAWLARWRTNGWETSAEQDAGRVAADHASPLLWAGLIAVSGGLAHGRPRT